MTEVREEDHLRRLWAQAKEENGTPVVIRRPKSSSYGTGTLVRLPAAFDNGSFLRCGRLYPAYLSSSQCWELPASWFTPVVRKMLQRFERVYVIQLYREKEVCAPACWNATGIECECSCCGANHGAGRPSGTWRVVHDAFAVRYGAQKYGVQLMSERETGDAR